MSSVSPRCRALAQFLDHHREPSWRLQQVLHGVYKAHKIKWHAIDGLPDTLKWRLKDQFGKYTTSFKPEAASEGDSAEKLLLKSRTDEARVEAVSLKFHSHRSLCISSQVGCSFQCAFCATGKVGFKRQLDADEISDQVLLFLQRGHKVDGVSFMGMGEPLGNPKIFDALRILTASELYGMSARRLNVSTVGVLPGIVKLTEEFPQVNLAFSLHSPFTEERNKLVPLNRMFPMEEVFNVLDQRIRSTGRRIWICYLLLQGINDSADHARALAQIIRDRPAETRYLYHVNLLPYNVGRAVPERYSRARPEGVEQFQRVLQQKRVSSSYRNSFGHGIDAACGQLFAGYEEVAARAARLGPGPDNRLRPKAADMLESA
mmetsp:Transcript_4045/g.9493  ORF Transcript_4045/g.9493 Transcript_4045/m.9493 type:complete len:375 (+) Transcript_4045:60-1184(+)